MQPDEPDAARLRRVAADPRYQALVARRARFAWLLTALMLGVYFGYILAIAFWKDLLARPIGDRATTWGIPIGLGVILVGIALTALYIRRANRDFEPMAAAIRDEAGR